MTSRGSLRYVAVVEARMTSSRLPGKMMMTIGGKPALRILIERLRRVQELDGIGVATSDNAEDDPLADLCEDLGVECFRGSEHDVLGRVLGAARSFGADVIVEITGDCTFLDPTIVGEGVRAHRSSRADFVANCVRRPHYPPGMDVRVFSTALLAEVDESTDDPDDREHVSLYFWEHPERYDLLHLEPPEAWARSDLFIALDEKEDLEFLRRIHDHLAPRDPAFGLREILELLDERPEIRRLVESVPRRGAHDG